MQQQAGVAKVQGAHREQQAKRGIPDACGELRKSRDGAVGKHAHGVSSSSRESLHLKLEQLGTGQRMDRTGNRRRVFCGPLQGGSAGGVRLRESGSLDGGASS